MQRLKRVWGQSITHKIAIILAVVFLIVVIGGYTGSWYFSWTGLADYTKPPGVTDRGKTLWDWLELLIIPAVLAGGAMWFSRAEREAEREIASDRLREAALQGYLDKMTELLLEKDLRTSEADDEARAVARARTLTVLRQLDGERRATLLRFLYEAKLINKDDTVVDLHMADLSQADLIMDNLSEANLSWTSLREAYLIEANLSKANLSEADLSKANLIGADLSGANLVRAGLCGANLIRADLSEANLRGANLSGANLDRAKLSKADLIEANLIEAYLSGADLSGADLSEADLSGANLSGAELNGADLSKITYDDNTTWPDDFTPPPDANKE
jgi:uncharacterized protein YjbI with pentapeptide repeats